MIYTVKLDRVGRHHDIFPIEVETNAPGVLARVAEVEATVYQKVRPFLASRDVEVVADLDVMRVFIYAGVRSAGTGTITVKE